MSIFQKINQFMIEEIIQLTKSPLPAVIAFVLPVAAWIILLLTFKNGYVSDLPVCIIDKDNSSLSRKIIRDIDATEALDIKYSLKDMDEAESLMKKSKCYFIISIEKDFSKNIKKGSSGSVNIIENGFYLMYAKVGYKVIAQTLLENSNNIQINRLINSGFGLNEASQRAIPVKTDIFSYGNPYFNYAIYLIPGMIISILQMSGSFSALWLFRHSAKNSEKRIIPAHSYKLSYLLGKSIPLLIINILTVIVLFTFFLPLSGIPISSTYFAVFLNAVLLIIVSFGMGAILSLLLDNLVSASQVLLVINAPAFVFSGYTFPRWAMPDVIKWFAELIPVTKFLDSYFPAIIYNTFYWQNYLSLGIYALIFWGLITLILTKPGINLFTKLKLFNPNILTDKI